MLTVENLNKKYVSHGSVTSALVDINLRIEEGEFVACSVHRDAESRRCSRSLPPDPGYSGRITINGQR